MHVSQRKNVAAFSLRASAALNMTLSNSAQTAATRVQSLAQSMGSINGDDVVSVPSSLAPAAVDTDATTATAAAAAASSPVIVADGDAIAVRPPTPYARVPPRGGDSPRSPRADADDDGGAGDIADDECIAVVPRRRSPRGVADGAA